MTQHIEDRLKAVDSRTFEAKVGVVVKRTHASIKIVESDPMVIMTALVELLLLFLVTELMDRFDPKEVRRQAFRFFRVRMDAMLKKYEEAEKMLGSSNDA